MNSRENQVTYSSKNSYSTLNELSAKTKNVWIVFHGIGYLSRYFLKYFDDLPADENYIIAPQAPSKYYLNEEYRHVGASWLTKEATGLALGNVLNYLDKVYKKEDIPKDCNLIILGYSQGVSIALRWVASRKISCCQLVLYAGGIPTELKSEDFAFLKSGTMIKVIVGDRDEYLTPERMQIEKNKIEALFPARAELISFDGKHEIKKEILNTLV
jgi:predicted esterase